MKQDRKKPLFRKENKSSLSTHYYVIKGGDFRHERHTKEMKSFQGNKKSMNPKNNLGYDYTPLYRFLQSKVGKPWNDVHAEAVSRLNGKEGEEAIFHLVYPNLSMVHPRHGKVHYGNVPSIVRMGENSMYHSLTVDEDGILQFIDRDAKWEHSLCSCCTHTLDGKVIKNSE
jgi:hypothetical protein